MRKPRYSITNNNALPKNLTLTEITGTGKKYDYNAAIQNFKSQLNNQNLDNEADHEDVFINEMPGRKSKSMRNPNFQHKIKRDSKMIRPNSSYTMENERQRVNRKSTDESAMKIHEKISKQQKRNKSVKRRSSIGNSGDESQKANSNSLAQARPRNQTEKGRKSQTEPKPEISDKITRIHSKIKRSQTLAQSNLKNPKDKKDKNNNNHNKSVKSNTATQKAIEQALTAKIAKQQAGNIARESKVKQIRAAQKSLDLESSKSQNGNKTEPKKRKSNSLAYTFNVNNANNNNNHNSIGNNNAVSAPETKFLFDKLNQAKIQKPSKNSMDRESLDEIFEENENFVSGKINKNFKSHSLRRISKKTSTFLVKGIRNKDSSE